MINYIFFIICCLFTAQVVFSSEEILRKYLNSDENIQQNYVNAQIQLNEEIKQSPVGNKNPSSNSENSKKKKYQYEDPRLKQENSSWKYEDPKKGKDLKFQDQRKEELKDDAKTLQNLYYENDRLKGTIINRRDALKNNIKKDQFKFKPAKIIDRQPIKKIE